MKTGPLTVSALVERSWSETLVVGHRGAAATKPENTLESFREAIACKAAATECDVHVSKDGVPVVIHDATLDRTTSLKGRVDETEMEALALVGVPTLEQYLDTTKGRIVSVIEIKAGQNVVRKTVDAVKRKEILAETIVFSFNEEYLHEAKELEPKLFSVWLKSSPENYSAHLARAQEIRADAIGVGYPAATEELARLARSSRVPLFVWTVPPGPEVDRLKGVGVNFIITDHPRDVLAQLH